MNENQTQTQTAEQLADQLRTKLLQELLYMQQHGLNSYEDRILAIESATHILNALDPARSGIGSYATLTATAEKIEPAGTGSYATK